MAFNYQKKKDLPITPGETLGLLEEARQKLSMENESLKKFGRAYAKYRGRYKKQFAVETYKHIATGESCAGSEAKANGTINDLRQKYEASKIMWETQKSVCKNIATECSILQTISKALEKEWAQSAD